MRLFGLNAAFVAAGFLAGCRTPHEPTHFELAEKARAAGDNATALKEYRTAVEMVPDHKYAWLNIGYIEVAKGGGRDQLQETRNAFLHYLQLETYRIGDMEGNPEEPYLAQRLSNSIGAVIHTIGQIEREADVIYSLWVSMPEDEELKKMAIESENTVLEANMGVAWRAHYRLGEIARRSGDAGGAKGHYEMSVQQAEMFGRKNPRATLALSLVGGDLDAGWMVLKSKSGSAEDYMNYADAAIAANDLGRAVYALEEGRRHYARPDLFRKLAEAYLLADQPANAEGLIRALEMWKLKSKEVEGFLRVCWAAEANNKVADWSKRMEKIQSPAEKSFDGARLAAHIEGSGVSAEGKAAVKKAAAKLGK